MGEYLTIYFGTSSAAPKAIEFDKALIVADGSSALSQTKVYELSSDDWDSTLLNDGFGQDDRIYKSVATFFSASPTPDRVFVYAHVSGDVETYNDVPLSYVSGTTWEVPQKPIAGFAGDEQVKFYGCGQNVADSGVVNKADGSEGVGFIVDKGADGKWTGYLSFPSGLSGWNGVVDPLSNDCKITVDFTAGTQSTLGSTISEYNINMVALALDNSDSINNYTDNIFGSQLDDMMTIKNAIAGKNCMWFYALPGNASPEDIIAGTTSKWKELKSVIGAIEAFAPIKIIPGNTNDDMAVGYMAMTAISHPHKPLGFAEPHMAVKQAEPAINRAKWKDARIACIMKRTELAGDPFLVTYGFTFGSGDFDRIEGVRCRYIIAQSLINNLWALLAKRNTLMSYEGMQKIKATIRATFNTLISQGIVDGLKSVSIPIEEDLAKNTTAGQIARQKHEVPSVEIEYLWYTSVERIIITRAENVAT